MKLTKGKISKAIRKKKQSMKKYKRKNVKKSGVDKTKTFRKRKGTNLLKSTLKNYGMLGGTLDPKYDISSSQDLAALSKISDALVKIKASMDASVGITPQGFTPLPPVKIANLPNNPIPGKPGNPAIANMVISDDE